MNGIDGLIERYARGLARRSGRRGFLARLGTVIVGGAALPLLPIARGFAAPPTSGGAPPEVDGPEGDPKRC